VKWLIAFTRLDFLAALQDGRLSAEVDVLSSANNPTSPQISPTSPQKSPTSLHKSLAEANKHLQLQSAHTRDPCAGGNVAQQKSLESPPMSPILLANESMALEVYGRYGRGHDLQDRMVGDVSCVRAEVEGARARTTTSARTGANVNIFAALQRQDSGVYE